MLNLYITIGAVVGFCSVILTLSCILDCSKARRNYPHEKLSASDYTFKTVYKHSLLYNLPLISLFGFRDVVIPSCAKGLWLSLMLIIITCLSLFVFMITVINKSVIMTSLAIAPVLALLLLPNSILIKIVRTKAIRRNVIKIETNVVPKAIHNNLSKD